MYNTFKSIEIVFPTSLLLKRKWFMLNGYLRKYDVLKRFTSFLKNCYLPIENIVSYIGKPQQRSSKILSHIHLCFSLYHISYILRKTFVFSIPIFCYIEIPHKSPLKYYSVVKCIIYITYVLEFKIYIRLHV